MPENIETIQGAIDVAVDGDIIIVTPGTYEETINFYGKAIIVGSYYYTTQDTSYIAETIIDGGGSGSVVVFENEEDSTTVLTGFTITNGHADEGGGIRCYHSNPIIDNLIVRDNWALIGGGVHIEGSDVILSEMRISNNVAMYDGAGVFVISNISLTIMNSSIINNTTLNGWGGGIMIWETGTHLQNVYIAGNHADGDGGGIYARNLYDDMESVIVENNTANGNGGGIYLRSSKSALSNSVIADNSAGSLGGGIYFQYATHDLINVTLANNTADSGGGIYCYYNCNIILVNTIMWENSLQEIYFAESESANTVVVTYSDIDNGLEGIVTNNNGEVIWLEDNIEIDPLFDDQPGWEYHLTLFSPCVDAGTAYFEYEGETLVDMSEDEYWGLAPDMGAFEFIDVNEIQYGDVDDNDEIDSYDASVILMYVVGLDPLPEDPVPWEEWRLLRADVNLNNFIGALDAAYILQYVVGIIDELPVINGIRGFENTVSLSNDSEFLYLNSDEDLISLEYKIIDCRNIKLGKGEVIADNCLFYQNNDQLALASATGISGNIVRIPYYRINNSESLVIIELTGNGQSKQIYYTFPDPVPFVTQLNAVYPNPFNPETTVCYQLAESGKVSIEVYNIKGQKVSVLLDEEQEAGEHNFTWNAAGTNSGVYFIRLTSGTYQKTSKAVLLK